MSGNGGSGPLSFLDERADPVCPVCSSNDYETPKDVSRVYLPVTDQKGRAVVGGGMAAIPLICGNCGFIRLHAVAIIEGHDAS
jgi:hypothetical protein